MSAILQDGGVLPDKNYSLARLHQGVTGTIGRNPSIHCIHDPIHDEVFLSEIRICFNKSLELTDCDGVMSDDMVAIDYMFGKIITNCPLGKPILYPSVVPKSRLNRPNWKFPFVNFYKLVQLLQWLTI